MSIMCLITTKTITRICWLVINLTCLTTALKDVHVIVPTAVKRGDNAALTCHYDLEKDTLYSIKWYKGRREFYRYTPRENPPMQVFAVGGINVERSMSNASHVLLKAVDPTVSGKYSCEVSADAPSFHTLIVSGDLEVVDLPDSRPTIYGINKVYSVGDIISANCSLSRSKPAANLTWLINNYTASPINIVRYLGVKDDSEYLETSSLGLNLVLTPKHFRSSKFRLACRAWIYEIYDEIVEEVIELDTSSNLIQVDVFSTIENSKHSQYENGFDDIRMHHIQADMSSSASTSSSSGLSFWTKSSSDNRRENVFYHLGVSLVTVARTLMYSSTRLNKSL